MSLYWVSSTSFANHPLCRYQKISRVNILCADISLDEKWKVSQKARVVRSNRTNHLGFNQNVDHLCVFLITCFGVNVDYLIFCDLLVCGQMFITYFLWLPFGGKVWARIKTYWLLLRPPTGFLAWNTSKITLVAKIRNFWKQVDFIRIVG